MWDIMRLVEQGGAFGFWEEEGEDIYSSKDGEPAGVTRPTLSRGAL